MEADSLFDDIAEDLAPRGASTGNMFGARALKANGKAFGCLLKDGTLALRLGAGTPEHTAALEVDGAELFDPSGKGQPFKDWVAIPVGQSDRWPDLAEAALAFLVK